MPLFSEAGGGVTSHGRHDAEANPRSSHSVLTKRPVALACAGVYEGGLKATAGVPPVSPSVDSRVSSLEPQLPSLYNTHFKKEHSDSTNLNK